MKQTSDSKNTRRGGWPLKWGALLVGAIIVASASTFVTADHQPADKVAVSGSAAEVVGPLGDTQILSATLKTSSPTDLVIHASAECAIFTDTNVTLETEVKNGKGSDKESAQATSRVEMWLEVDATPDDDSDDDLNKVIPVSSDDTGGSATDISLDNDVPPQAASGRVVYCHRTQGLEAEIEYDFEDEINFTNELFLRTYLGTRSAHSFNWVTLDMGSGTYEIELHAQIVDETDTTEGGDAAAKGVVGKRTLIVQPLKLPNDADI